jgi:GNAT superfamily N-acetyltransferase
VLEQRPAVPGDEPFLRELFASTRPDLAGWEDNERELFLDIQLRAQKIGWEARFPGSTDEIILLDGRPVGRVWVAWSPDVCVLVDVELMPEARGIGLGTRVLEPVMVEADRRGLPVRSTVERRNTASLALAARLGLVPTGEDEVYVSLERPVNPDRPPPASA